MCKSFDSRINKQKILALSTFYNDLTFYFYTNRFQLSNFFLLAGSSSHLTYRQRGNWNLMGKDYILRCFIFYFQYLCRKIFPLFSELALFTNFLPTIRISVCTLTINIESKALVNEPAI